MVAPLFRADLHCHTTCSDGTVTPTDLLHLAKELGLNGLSITDHDTQEAYNHIIPLAQTLEISLISGIEFSSMHGNESVHILGYAYQLFHPAIDALCQKHRHRRKERNLAILSKLKQKGMLVEEEEIQKISSTSIGRPHIAQVLYQKGYVRSIPEAFKKYIGEGKSCYDKGESISVEETIETIHKAKGFAVIAHPHLIFNEPLFQKLLTMNFDGIECHYSLFGPAQNRRYLEIAKQRQWLALGGSDFHGTVKPKIPLGCSWTEEDTFHILKERFSSHGLPKAS